MADSTQQVLEEACVDHFQDDAREYGRHGPHTVEASAILSPLLRTIECEVIPRLMLAHSGPSRASPRDAVPAYEVTVRDVERFTLVILDGDLNVALGEVDLIRARGAALEEIYLGLLAGTARHLGVMWDEDLCDFTQVTAGLWQLQRVLNRLSGGSQDEAVRRADGRVILLSGTPGEQHSFGLRIVAEFFRRARWQVANEVSSGADEIVGAVRDEWFAVVGFSLAAERHAGTLRTLVTRVRRHSANRAVGILVGGAAFLENPNLASFVGADAMANDGAQAVAKASAILSLVASGT